MEQWEMERIIFSFYAKQGKTMFLFPLIWRQILHVMWLVIIHVFSAAVFLFLTSLAVTRNSIFTFHLFWYLLDNTYSHIYAVIFPHNFQKLIIALLGYLRFRWSHASHGWAYMGPQGRNWKFIKFTVNKRLNNKAAQFTRS